LIAAQGAGQVQLWTLGESQPNWLRQYGSHVRDVAFSPDDKRVMLAFLNGGVETLDRYNGRDVASALQLPGPAIALARADDRWRIACGNLSVFDWDGRSLQVHPVLQHSSIVGIMQFDFGCRRLLTSGRPHGVRLWDVATGRSLTPPMFDLVAVGPILSRDGHTIYFATIQGQVRKWSSPNPVVGDIAKLKLWIDVVTGTEMDAAGVVTPLEPEEWQRRKTRLMELGGGPR
jgi:WD40 repeat protein